MLRACASYGFLRQFRHVNLSSACRFSDELPQVERPPIKSRNYFSLPSKNVQQKWYPKHMSIQFDKMEAKIRSVDLIIEVHDARIALTGRNSEFQARLFSIRPHILIFNKRDLIDKKYRKRIEEYYHGLGIENILWTDCKKAKKQALSDLQAMMLKLLQNEHRFNRAVKTEYQIMVVGIPNVGKSSLINALRKNNLKKEGRAVAVGSRPGVTIRVQNRVRILDTPPIYILDTPGVLDPFSRGLEDTMKLGLVDSILGTTLESWYVADYLLYWMNKFNDYSYLEALGLECGPTDDLQQLLLEICKVRNFKQTILFPGKGPVERWNFNGAVGVFVHAFRSKLIKDCFLDKDKF